MMYRTCVQVDNIHVSGQHITASGKIVGGLYALITVTIVFLHGNTRDKIIL